MSDRERRDRCLGRLVGKLRRTIRRWQLLPPGARVALGISGGGDSLAMALLLSAHREHSQGTLDMVGLHVTVDADGISVPLADETRSWCLDLGLRIEEVSPRLDPTEKGPLDCFRCAKVRRRTLLEAADAMGRPLLALGHHADDVVETWLMSVMYSGTPEAMAPSRSYFGGAVTVIRPLYEIRRQELRRLVRLFAVPVSSRRCEREEESKRARVCEALSVLGRDERVARRNIFWAAARQYETEHDGVDTR